MGLAWATKLHLNMQFLDLKHSAQNRSGHMYYLPLDMCQGEDDTKKVSQQVHVLPGQKIQEASSCSATLPGHSQTMEQHWGETRPWEKRSLRWKENTDQISRVGRHDIEKQVKLIILSNKQSNEKSIYLNTVTDWKKEMRHILLVADTNLHEWLFPFAQMQESFKAIDFLDPKRRQTQSRWDLDNFSIFCSLSKSVFKA